MGQFLTVCHVSACLAQGQLSRASQLNHQQVAISRNSYFYGFAIEAKEKQTAAFWELKRLPNRSLILKF